MNPFGQCTRTLEFTATQCARSAWVAGAGRWRALRPTRSRSNAAGLLTARTEAHGTAKARTTTFEYQSGTNLLTATVDALSRRTEMVYDARGNVITLRTLAGTPSQMTQTFTYTSDWNLLSTATDALGKITRYFYDTRWRLTEVRNALNNSTRF